MSTAEVQNTWAMVEGHPLGLEGVGVLFFKRIFEIAPEALTLFSFKDRPNMYESPELKAHAVKVIKTVGVAVAGLSDLDKLVPVLTELGKKHVGYGVLPAHYDVVGQALLDTLEVGLGEAWTPSAKKAWVEVYGVVKATMIGDNYLATKNGKMPSPPTRPVIDHAPRSGHFGAAQAETAGAVAMAALVCDIFLIAEEVCTKEQLVLLVHLQLVILLAIGALVKASTKEQPREAASQAKGGAALPPVLLAATTKTRVSLLSGDKLGVDEKDTKTPDQWVRRHPELVRLTGRHPFNCEPPMPLLKAGGFLTPPTLHYVRNHGAVPVSYANPQERQAVWDGWSIKVNGLVDTPLEITMEQLLSLPQRELPVLLVCAGNRRKEQNRVAKTVGFNWGPAGLATNLWTGVRLSDILKLAGAKCKAEGAGHVCFKGPDKELPGGDDGSYGTSVPLECATDPAQEMLIAFKQNGQWLEPDHGFPVRLIIPGYIGGRMIKWLKEVTVTPEQSDNFYHFMDNRVLPVGVTPESATAEDWWHKPDYIINQLNVNSSMWAPAHDETKLLLPEANLEEQEYELSGYAYTGNGVKVIRVEVSLDNGETWELGTVDHPEAPTEHGRYWCWCFWSAKVKVSRLAECGEVMCRAWDACQNTQPKDLTWNVMGMMNNPWFRVRVHKVLGPDNLTVIGLRFEHPTLPGQQEGGWMSREGDGWKKTATGAVFGLRQAQVVSAASKKNALTNMVNVVAAGKATETIAAAAADPSGVDRSKLPRVTMAEVEKHITEEDSWFVVNGVVYDSTAYNKDHPGGADSIVMVAGQDATPDFEAIHSKKAWKLLASFAIGVIDDGSAPAPAAATAESATEETVALVPRKKCVVTLTEKTVVGNDGTNDVILLKLAFPNKSMRLGLPTGKHFMVYATEKNTGKTVARAYTPITDDFQVGSVELVVKVYGVAGKEGKMSTHMGGMVVGETLELKGPIGHIEYMGKGAFKFGGKDEVTAKHVGMICGGTGITPMFQVVQASLRDPEDKTCFHLIYANRSTEGVMLEEELDAFVSASKGRVTVEHVCSAKHAGCKRRVSVGHISGPVLEEFMCGPAGGAGNVELVFMCGPQPMIDLACIPALGKLGFDKEQLHCF